MGNWDTVIQVATLVLQLLAGVGSTNLIDWLKAQLKLQGHWVLALTAAVATVIAVATLVVEGALTAENVSWDNFVQVFILVIGAAQVRYNMLKSKETNREVAKVRVIAAVAQEMAGDAMTKANAGGATETVVTAGTSTWGYGGDGK